MAALGMACWGPGRAAAQPGQDVPSTAPGAGTVTAPGAVTATSEETGPENQAEDRDDDEQSVAGERELGARLGLATGGRVTPGGLRVAGVMLYRMSDDDWFEGSLAFTYGGGGGDCFMDRDQVFRCNHGVADGAAADITAGVRRFLTANQRFVPYVRAGVGVRLISFRDDDVQGLAIPLSVGAGVRTKVHEIISLGGDISGELGAGVFNRNLGLEPQLGLVVQASIEFWLD